MSLNVFFYFCVNVYVVELSPSYLETLLLTVFEYEAIFPCLNMNTLTKFHSFCFNLPTIVCKGGFFIPSQLYIHLLSLSFSRLGALGRFTVNRQQVVDS